MNMLATEFLLFTVFSAGNAYLPVFLQLQNYSATEIGYLYGIFNASGIIIPMLLVPLMAKKGKFSLWLFLMALQQCIVSLFIFRVNNFLWSAVFMSLFAITYRGQVPVSDSIITKALGSRQDRYGIVRASGTLGFIVMSLVMQQFVHIDKISVNQMSMWFAVPSALFALSLVVRQIILSSAKKRKASAAPDASSASSSAKAELKKSGSDDRTTWQVLKEFKPEFYLILFVAFMEYFGMVPANNFISMYAHDVLHADIVGLLWAINAGCEFPFMLLSSFFIKKFGERKMIMLCTLAVTVRLFFYAFIPGVSGAVLGQCMHSFTFGLFYPACISYCSKSAGGSSRASIIVMTMLNICTTLPSVIGAAFGGVIIDNLGYRSLFLIFSIFPFAAVVFAEAVTGISRRRKIHK